MVGWRVGGMIEGDMKGGQRKVEEEEEGMIDDQLGEVRRRSGRLVAVEEGRRKGW